MEFNGTVLIVDDEPHIRKYIGLILRKFGNPTIVEAGNGEEALALFPQHNPDLVLLDVNMPMMDGLQCLERLVAEHPDALVVMLTSLATRNVVERCFNKLKQWRGIAMRSDKLARNYRAAISLAATLIWIKTDLSRPAWP